MKIIQAFAPALLVMFILGSCQKEYSPSDPNTPATVDTSSRVKTYTEDVTDLNGHTVITFNVAYDASYRLQSLISTTNPGDKFVYGYAAGSATLDLYNSGALSVHSVLFPNTSGSIDSAFQIDDTNDTTTDKFFYNNAKQLVEDITYVYNNGVPEEDNVTNYLYDASGNVIQETDDNGTTTNDFYTGKVNNISLGTPYMPVAKGLVKTSSYDDGSGTIVTAQHTYTFDSSNRIITDTAIADNGEKVIKSYTYY